MTMISAIGIYKFNQHTLDSKIALYAQEDKDTTNYQLQTLELETLPQFLKEDNFYSEKKCEREYHFLLKEFNSSIILTIVSKSYIVKEEIPNLFTNIKRIYWAHNSSKSKNISGLLKTNLSSIIGNPQGYIGPNARLEFTNGISYTLDDVIKKPELFSDNDIVAKQIKALLTEIIEICLDNIDKLLERKEKLDALVEKAELISEHSIKFHRVSKDLNKCQC